VVAELSRRGPIRTCSRCGRDRRHEARGLCVTCYRIVWQPYVPTGVGRGGPGVGRSADDMAGRMADVEELLGRRYSGGKIAERLGLSDRTVRRYISRLRQGESGGRALGELGPGLADIPGDELPDDLGPVPVADEAAECGPQLIADPDGPVRGVGGLHTAHRNPWISARRGIGVAVDIHER